MSTADVTLTRLYAVGRGDVYLSLLIGEGQFGTSDILLGETRLLRASGPIGDLRVGSGPDVRGETLVVRSIVNDVSTRTNRMSVTYRLRGGKVGREFRARGLVDSEGELLIFEARFSLE